jgi:hypothetical protein
LSAPRLSVGCHNVGDFFLTAGLQILCQFFFWLYVGFLKWLYVGGGVKKWLYVGATLCHFLSDIMSVIEKRLYDGPTMCHFLSDFVSVVEKQLYVGPTMCHFYWLCVGHSKMISCRPDIVSFFLNFFRFYKLTDVVSFVGSKTVIMSVDVTSFFSDFRSVFKNDFMSGWHCIIFVWL